MNKKTNQTIINSYKKFLADGLEYINTTDLSFKEKIIQQHLEIVREALKLSPEEENSEVVQATAKKLYKSAFNLMLKKMRGNL
jgi:hypothetical protein